MWQQASSEVLLPQAPTSALASGSRLTQGAYTIEVGIDSKLNYNDTQYLEDLMAEAIEGAYRKALKIK